MSDGAPVAAAADPPNDGAGALTPNAPPAAPVSRADLQEEDDEEEEEKEEAEGGGSAPDYGRAGYWDDRYTRLSEPFDWYQSWSALNSILGPFFDEAELALNVGCGNSPMAVDMSASFQTVVNIDISTVVIAQMERDNQDKSNILWFHMDCTHMDFEDNTFDVAFDKGTLDALFCGEAAILKVGRALAEIHRVLRPCGLFFEITHAKPDSRVTLFNGCGLAWTLHEPVPIRHPQKLGWHFIYIFEKNAPDELEDHANDN
jgi:SAM-dependent methyltransferase